MPEAKVGKGDKPALCKSAGAELQLAQPQPPYLALTSTATFGDTAEAFSVFHPQP
jgi:hypothetical protein